MAGRGDVGCAGKTLLGPSAFRPGVISLFMVLDGLFPAACVLQGTVRIIPTVALGLLALDV